MNKELLIQKYFKGTLNTEEGEHFAQLMRSDEEFKADVAEYEDLQKAIKEQERQVLKEKLLQLESNIVAPNTSSNVKRLWPLAIAAAVALLLAIAGILYWPQNEEPENLYAAYYEPYPNALRPLKRGQESTDPEIQAFLAYEEGDFVLAANKFETLLADQDSPDVQFYYAMSLLNSGDLEKAQIELKQVDGKTSKFQPQIEWYSALIYLDRQEWQKAEKALDRLDELDTVFKKEDAQKLKQHLLSKESN